jgi:AmmeMemoRadiSam system protein B
VNAPIVLGPAVAGSFYPAGRAALATLVDRLLAQAPETRGQALAAIAPHAGFSFSGALAAASLRAIAGPDVARVILIGPSHYFGFRGAAMPDAARAYRTPLGDVPIDVAALGSLRAQDGIIADDRYFAREHALECELPFLQHLLPAGFALIPILLGGAATRVDAARLAGQLLPLIDAGTRVVVSSDFTHYGPRFDYVPFMDDVPARLLALDHGAVRAIEAGDAAAFASYVDATGATICGRRAIDVLLGLPCGRAGGRLLAYDTSGRQTGQWDHSVSYASMVFPA